MSGVSLADSHHEVGMHAAQGRHTRSETAYCSVNIGMESHAMCSHMKGTGMHRSHVALLEQGPADAQLPEGALPVGDA